MSEYFIQRKSLTDIGDAIREKTSASGIIKISKMAEHIRTITPLGHKLTVNVDSGATVTATNGSVSWSEDWGDRGTFVLPYELGMEECWAVMDDIIEDAVIKKPFSSKPGKFVAKIINKICNVFHKPRK